MRRSQRAGERARGEAARRGHGRGAARGRCERVGSGWPPSTMQKGIRLNDGHVASLGLLARQDGTRKGYLSKRSADNTKWQTKWFALLHNLLFYFESDSSTRPSGLYLLEGCVCDRAPSPKPALSAKEPPEKQVRLRRGSGPSAAGRTQTLVPGLSARPWRRAGRGCGCGCPPPATSVGGRPAGRRGGEARGRGPGPDSQEECEPASSPKWCSPPPLPPLRPGAPDHLPRPGGAAPARWRGRERWMHGARVPASPQPGAGAPSRALPSSGCRPQGPAGRHRAVMVSQQHTEGSQAPR